MEQQLLQRNRAIKITIAELLWGTYVQENEQNPNYLLTKDNQKIYRLNLIATIVQKELVGTITNLLIDDGGGKIIIRSFEENEIINTLNIGDVIIIIGKLRVFNQEKYISPEIIKQINPLWLKHRSLELKDKFLSIEIKHNDEGEDKKKIISKDDETILEENVIEESLLPFQKIIQLIKELDEGDGVLIEEIIEKSPLDKTEEVIKKMLKSGDIFQNNPGRVKVL